MSSYTFNFNVADQTLDHMDSVNKAIRAALEELHNNCQKSLAEWEGDARTQYYEAKARWDGAAEQMTLALQAGRVSLFNISEGYGSAEQRGTQIWANTRTGF